MFTEHRKKLELNHSICIQRIVIIVCIFNCIEYTYTGVLGSSKLNNIYTFKRYASSMLNYLIIYIKLEVLKSFFESQQYLIKSVHFLICVNNFSTDKSKQYSQVNDKKHVQMIQSKLNCIQGKYVLTSNTYILSRTAQYCPDSQIYKYHI